MGFQVKYSFIRISLVIEEGFTYKKPHKPKGAFKLRNSLTGLFGDDRVLV